MNASMEQLRELLGDEEFVSKISRLEDNAAVQQAFKDRGIDFTLEELNELAARISEDSSELSEENLENVNGGIVITTTTLTAIGAVAAGVGLFCNVMSEVNSSRKAAGKKPIW